MEKYSLLQKLPYEQLITRFSMFRTSVKGLRQAVAGALNPPKNKRATWTPPAFKMVEVDAETFNLKWLIVFVIKSDGAELNPDNVICWTVLSSYNTDPNYDVDKHIPISVQFENAISNFDTFIEKFVLDNTPIVESDIQG